MKYLQTNIMCLLIFMFLFYDGFAQPNKTIPPDYSHIIPSPFNILEVRGKYQEKTNKFTDGVITVIDSVVLIKENNSKIRYSCSYYPSGKIEYYLVENRDENNWINNERYSYNYNQFGELKEALIEYWVGNTWVLDNRYSYEYDATGIMVSYLFERWGIINNQYQWINDSKVTYEYNDNDIVAIGEWWTGSDWKNDWKRAEQYNSNSSITSKTYYYSNGESWEKDIRIISEYEINGEVLSVLTQMWHGEWENQSRTINAFDNSNRLVGSALDVWEYGQWNTFSRNTYEYNDHNSRISDLKEIAWDFINFESYNRSTYQYDIDGNGINAIYEKWEDESFELADGNIGFYDSVGDYINSIGFSDKLTGAKLSIFYNEIVNVAETVQLKFDYSLSQNYPNPFNPNTTISYSMQQSGFVQLKVYDMLGREVASLVNKEQSVGNYKIDFNAQNLTSGIYFYRLQSGGFTETKKLILLR